MKATLYTFFALLAFAANSLFCRMALVEGHIDAWHFTIIRLVSAAVCLAIIMAIHKQYAKHSVVSSHTIANENGSWLSSISLVIYALCFSLAYVSLDTGTGALILFSAVQLTMIGWGIYKKERLNVLQWIAFIIAVAGFGYLMLPSATMPSWSAALLMAISGAAWGIYSIRGQSCVSPLRATGFNFIRSLLAVPLLLFIALSYVTDISMQGVLLAGVSGALASGVGYSIWYMAMPLLKSTQAAVVQLSVPVLAAIFGMVFLAETPTLEFITASLIILGAVLMFVLNGPKKQDIHENKRENYLRKL
ncbi:DMT family transporter [Psychrobacter sp. F1192]|uniref:DMT family transporter n=1 Tax=Psychrobacter coccoides TaxID=2818440 RepID=A0ABS3NL76_9GAMM|nr:DMT family transporter [Psychrobacter coccoides]MBO1530093.1 DMT family transporter [Psychrobacter coccoides]